MTDVVVVVVVAVFENKERIVLVIEYAAGGELYDHINERQGLYEDEARKLFRQITAAVHYLHSVSTQPAQWRHVYSCVWVCARGSGLCRQAVPRLMSFL